MTQIPDHQHEILAVLGEYLAPEHLAAFQAGLPVSAMARVAAAASLRAELTGLVSYLPPSIARRQMAVPTIGHVSGRFWAGTALFADLSGFTALSSTLSTLGKHGSEEISAIINTLFDALLAEVDQRAGNLLKFGGDALTAFFPADDLGESHAALACDAALAMQRAMARFADLPTRVGRFTLSLRIGVHSGQVFAAEVGDRAHLEVVITGHTINRVAAAQDLAQLGEVLITPETLALTDSAMVEPGPGGFLRLQNLLHVPVPPHLALPGAGSGLAALSLRDLAERVAALRPYLPHDLPHRFIMATGAETGEFRPVTMLFANVYDFSAVLTHLGDDVATATAILNAYFRRAQDVIHRYGGVVNKVDMYSHGDKLMALFGAPSAHENDPLRAVRCALDMAAALEEANREGAQVVADCGLPMIAGTVTDLHLTQKIGLNTGIVFAGRIGSSRRHEYTVMGSPVNLAARLMAAARDGAVLISPDTRRAVEGRVELRDLPPIRLKGIPDPVPLAETVRSLDLVADARPLNRGRLVGRDRDLEALIAIGRAASAGTGCVVTLVGEPGTGKTRLAEEAITRLGTDHPHRAVPLVCMVECQSYEQSTPYAGFRPILGQVITADIGIDAPPETIVAHLAVMVPELARFAPLAGDILGIPLPETPLTLALTPEQRHDNAHALCIELLLRITRDRLLIILCDDLQWADASTLAMIAALAARSGEVALLLLLIYRPDHNLAEPWRTHAYSQNFVLGELGNADAAQLAQALLGTAPPPALLTALARAQGNPFFVEELVRSLVETGALQRDGETWVITRTLDESVLPSSIESLIVARLDRLEERSRELMQVASVVGRRFRYEILTGLLGRRDELRAILESMMATTLLLPDELEHELAYLFKHALTRDVAYESILYARRHDLHRRVAQQIERLYASRIDEHLAIVAGHYLLAEAWPEAFEYHLRAGRLAQRRYANHESITLFERAREVGQRIGASVELRSEIHERMGWLFSRIGQFDTALHHFESALAMLDASQPLAQMLRLHHHVARVYEKRADFATSFTWVDRALQLTGATESHIVVRCLLLGSGLHMRQGRYRESQEWGEQALALGGRHGSERDQAQALKILGNIAISRGDMASALDLLSSAVEIYRSADDIDGLAYAHSDLAIVCEFLGRFGEARAHYEVAARMKEEIGDSYGQAIVASNLGELLRAQSDLAGAEVQYERAVAGFEKIGSRYGAGVARMNLGATYLQQDRLDAAESELQRALAIFVQVGAEDFLPEIERYIADLARRRGQPNARHLAEQALATARRLEARLEEGLTRRLLATILADAGDVTGAWDELGQSLDLLREAESIHQVARTQLARAALAPALGLHEEGRAALSAALATLKDVGAEAELAAAQEIGRSYGYE
jgi:class 3 adenylate cyclase/tetratricopeptide (TPR) repeat protein